MLAPAEFLLTAKGAKHSQNTSHLSSLTSHHSPLTTHLSLLTSHASTSTSVVTSTSCFAVSTAFSATTSLRSLTRNFHHLYPLQFQCSVLATITYTGTVRIVQSIRSTSPSHSIPIRSSRKPAAIIKMLARDI